MARITIRLSLFLSFLAVSSFLQAAGPEKIKIPTQDGDVVALYLSPTASTGTPVLVFAHGLASGKEEWIPFANRLPGGWGWLAYDARGHGESARAIEEYRRFGPPRKGSPWEQMVSDIGRVLIYLEKDGIDRSRMVLVGASLGANAALLYAGLTDRIPTVIALSAGADYQGLAPAESMHRFTGRGLLLAQVTDTYAFDGTRQLQVRYPFLTFWSDVPPGHGVQMLDEKTSKRIIDWIRRRP